jgi:hypothetical protein
MRDPYNIVICYQTAQLIFSQRTVDCPNEPKSAQWQSEDGMDTEIQISVNFHRPMEMPASLSINIDMTPMRKVFGYKMWSLLDPAPTYMLEI